MFELFYFGWGLLVIGGLLCVRCGLSICHFDLSILLGVRPYVENTTDKPEVHLHNRSKEGLLYIVQGALLALASIIICFIIPLLEADPIARLKSTWHIGSVILAIGLGQLYWGLRRQRLKRPSKIQPSDNEAEPR
jgi:hypothetical protein